MSIVETFDRLDRQIVHSMAKHGITLLRLALAIVFIWFGVLKLIGASPVADLVASTLPFLSPQVSVPLVGALEVIIGLGLATRFAMRLVLFLFFIQMAGTFLVFVLLPYQSFQGGNPLVLTATGEFVLKNFVLLTAGFVVGSTVRRPTERLPESPGQEPQAKPAK
jgi:uncharacterized membrane protein YkgB